MKIIATLTLVLLVLLTACGEPAEEPAAAAKISSISRSAFGLSSEALAHLINGPGMIDFSTRSGNIYVSRPPVNELIATGHLEVRREPDGDRVTILRSESGERVHRLFVNRKSEAFIDDLASP